MSKKEKIEVEIVDEVHEQKEEKKENVFSKFWKKTKQTVSDSLLEIRIESTYNKDKPYYHIYGKGDIMPLIICGKKENDRINVYGKVDTEVNNILLDVNADKAYYINSFVDSTVEVTVDGVSYNRPSTIIVLDDNVEEVNVIKAGKKYYLCKK